VSAKRFLLLFVVVYIGCALLGYALFQSPNLSPEYMAQHGQEHERFVAITRSHDFELFHQRPHLFERQGEAYVYGHSSVSAADVEFVEEYEANPAFQSEESRIAHFILYFKSFNSILFIWLVAHFARGPLVNLLDQKIHETRTKVDEAARARESAAQKQAEAKTAMAGWAETEKCMLAETDKHIADQVAKIQEEARLARIRLERDIEDHKRAETARAEAILREELVNKAIAELTERYKTQAPLDELKSNVDQFVRLTELLS